MDSRAPTNSPEPDSPDDAGGATASPDDPRQLTTEFSGRRWRLFWLALKTGTLTVLTLGFYRFWMKTRLRRWYWSAIRPGGVPLEYTGDPFEKLLGFLFAVVILAFYIGVVNLLLMFASFSLFQGNFAAYLLSFLGVIPLWFFARYRARRYVLARTRWRGIRLGLEPGAWGYAWRAMVHWALTIVTLGLLWPRMTFWLEKYRTDRTFYGSVRVNQGGSWTMLFRYILHPALGALASGLLILAFSLSENPVPLFGLALTLPWMGFGLAQYRAQTFRLLTEKKSVGGVEFRAAPRSWRVFAIYLFGYLIAGIGIVILLTRRDFCARVPCGRGRQRGRAGPCQGCRYPAQMDADPFWRRALFFGFPSVVGSDAHLRDDAAHAPLFSDTDGGECRCPGADQPEAA